MSTEPTSQSRDPDGDDDGFYELYDDAYAAWLDIWEPRCPIRNPQRVAKLVGYREREPGRLQLRAIVGAREGVCEAIVEEDEEEVRVRVLLCYPEHDEETEDNSFINCPVHVYLDTPLNGRAVIDVDTEQALPLFVPDWEDPSPRSEDAA